MPDDLASVLDVLVVTFGVVPHCGSLLVVCRREYQTYRLFLFNRREHVPFFASTHAKHTQFDLVRNLVSQRHSVYGSISSEATPTGTS